MIMILLVVTGTWLDSDFPFHIWECHHPNCYSLIFFSEGLWSTTNRMNMIYRDKRDDNDTSPVANNLGQNPEEVRVFLLFPTGFPTTFRYISVVSGLFSHGVRITLFGCFSTYSGWILYSWGLCNASHVQHFVVFSSLLWWSILWLKVRVLTI